MRGLNINLNHLWVSRSTSLWRHIFCGLLTLLLVNGLAWGADANKLLAVSVDSAAATPTVLIETAEPVGYRYTVYDSYEPTRVVIDFPGMALSSLNEAISINKGAVQEVRVSSFALSSGQLARVEIILAENTEYQVNLDGKNFRVAFATEVGAAATSPAPLEKSAMEKSAMPMTAPVVTVDAPLVGTEESNLLSGINLTAGQAILEANGKIDKFQHFTLENPPRLVVDVYNLRPGFKERSFNAEAGFDQVRVGTYNDKTRLVFDASGKALPEHTVEGRETNILVSWSSTQANVVAETKPPVVTVPKPVVPVAMVPKPVQADSKKIMGPVNVNAIDFANEDGRSVVTVALSEVTQVSDLVDEGNLVRFEIINATISRALRRTIDASAFPSAVSSVTPYTVTEGGNQNVRIAVDLKGPVAYALEQDGAVVRLVVDDAAYAESSPPALSQVEVVAPVAKNVAGSATTEQVFAPNTSTVTAAEMSAEAARYTGEKITLVFDSANVRSILQLIGDVSGLNILASSDVQGTVTLRLIDVPWDQALDLVLETARLGKIQQGNVLRIMPKDKIREIEQTEMKQQAIAIDEGVLEARTFPVSYASVDVLKGFLADIKSDRGSIIADSRNKQLIVRDVSAVLAQMQEMIAQIDKPERQVMIEARIVEAATNFARNLGVKWNFNYNDESGDDTGTKVGTGLGGAFLIPVINPAAAGFATNIGFSALSDQLDIDLRLSALESSGEGRIVSTPRITTLNGQTATISQGTKIPYSSVSDAGTDVKFENAELKLEVTPEINPDGSILLDINASNSAVGTIVPTSTGDAISIDEKKAQTKVLVRDGQTTVIGGIFIEDERDAATGVPILKDIPWIGPLFRSTTKTRDRRELLIFITPRIVQS